MKTHKQIDGMPARFRIVRSQFTGILSACALACGVLPATAGDFEESIAAPTYDSPVEGWKFGLELYAWLPGIATETSGGLEVELELDDILDNLNFTLMTAFAAKKGKWAIGTDVLYLDLGGETYAKGPLATKLDVELQSWVVNPVVGYDLYAGSRGTLQIIGGARYVYLKESTRILDSQIDVKNSSSGDAWAGIVGVRGILNLSEQWFMPYYADIGTGDPDLTWQAFLGIGYHFSKFDFIAGYRYLKFEMEDDAPLKDLKINGPIIGAKFEF